MLKKASRAGFAILRLPFAGDRHGLHEDVVEHTRLETLKLNTEVRVHAILYYHLMSC